MSDKIAVDVCEKQFEALCLKRRIETDVKHMGKIEAVLFESRKRTVLRAMARGELVINNDGNPQFTPPTEPGATPLPPIIFYKPTGATLMAQDGFPQNHDVARAAAVATELTKSAPGALSKLESVDFELVCEISNFLLGR